MQVIAMFFKNLRKNMAPKTFSRSCYLVFMINVDNYYANDRNGNDGNNGNDGDNGNDGND